VAFIAGLPDLSRIDEVPYSVAIHDIGLGGMLVARQFRRQQEDLAKMASFDSFAGYIAGRDSTKPGHSG
jgi:hypothetical protein